MNRLIPGAMHEGARHVPVGEPLGVHLAGTVGEVRQDALGIHPATGVEQPAQQLAAVGGEGAGGRQYQGRKPERLNGAVFVCRDTEGIEAQVQTNPGGDRGLRETVEGRVKREAREEVPFSLVKQNFFGDPDRVKLLRRHV
ncbi:hypothetical protein [Deinococcus hohokamensis]|uniref:Uncharacterized protein n=1 Tax=Deinococcus hohokamensis TaxID=309883 RepID=A0ABV9I7U2_9DEIO